MGAPATDYFCENGHHVDSAPHHCFCERDINDAIIPCPFCGSKNIKCIIEWGDPEYEQSCIVSNTPVKYDDVEQTDLCDNQYIAHIPVYDVSKLFNGAQE